MINKKTKMPLIYVGKTGTGKTTKALECLPPDPIIRYANEYDIEDNFSIPKDRGILIEEAHYKPNVDLIIKTILEYKGTIVLTSINQKDVPKKLYDMCKLKRAGTINHAQIKLKESGCINTEDIDSGLEKNIFEMINIYLRSKDRDKVAEMLKYNKPYDEMLLTWIMSSLKTEKIAFIDAKIKRRWSSDYLYELIAYAHAGAPISFSPPRRRAYDRRPLICRKIGLRPTDYDLLDMLKQDSEFENHIYKVLSPVDRTAVGVKKQIVVKKQKEKTVTLEDYL